MNTRAYISLIGIGEEGVNGLLPEARIKISQAQHVFGGERHLALAHDLIRGETYPWSHPLTETIPFIEALKPNPVVVLASGDPFFFGVGSTLLHFIEKGDIVSYPSCSSLTLACNRLGWAQQECTILSFCGRPVETLRPHLHPYTRLLALCANHKTPGHISQILIQNGFEDAEIHLMECLGGPHERIRQCTPLNLPGNIHALNMVGIILKNSSAPSRIVPLAHGLANEFFHHDGQISTQPVRALTLAALKPMPNALLWDIGAGSGSVGIEWMLAHPTCRTIAIESHTLRAERAQKNALELGVPAYRMIKGTAPDILENLPPPDAIFIGGGGQQTALSPLIWSQLKKGGRLVMNAVTLESENIVTQLHSLYGGTLMRIQTEHLAPIGRMEGFVPARTITQYAVTKPYT